MTWLCERHKRLARDGGVCVNCQNEIDDLIARKKAMTPSPSTLGQDADPVEIDLIGWRYRSLQTAQTINFDIMLIQQLLKDVGTLLHSLKSRQPHVALARHEIAKLLCKHISGTYGQHTGYYIQGIDDAANAVYDRLCLTKAESE